MQYLFRPRTPQAAHPDPDGRPEHAAKVGKILSTWKRFFPDAALNPDVDFEDWVENAVQLHAAASRDDLTVFVQPSRDTIAPSLAGDDFDAGAPFIVAGVQYLVSDFSASSPFTRSPTVPEFRAAEAYAMNNGFAAHAGRRLALAGFDDGDGLEGDNLADVLQRWRDEGHASAVVKTTQTKKGLAHIELEGRSDRQIEQALMDTFEYTLINLAGKPDQFMVQERVDMTHEYRVFVVDGVAVAGAGCLEECTPLDNAGDAFDLRTREARGTLGTKPTEAGEHADVVARYREALPKIIDDLQAGNPKLGTFVVDLCMVGDQVAVVELNPARCAGFYALDVDRLLEALVMSAATAPSPSTQVRMKP